MPRSRREPPRCSCQRYVDTPEFPTPGSSGRKSGLHSRQAADHGDPYAHTGSCKHDTLNDTTKRYKKPKYKHVRGTRRIVAVFDEQVAERAPKRRRA